ncbi:MAG: hypothetical protein GQ574_01050 [Crocinitomix sp.]|nr:hypothetical protein [Crocinitomix sp.]
MIKVFYFFCFFSFLSANGQMLDNIEGKTFGEVPFFNESFVQRNKIKTIKGYYSTKATLDIIRKSKDVYYYEFNAKGQLIQDYRTQYGDTLISIYEYNEQGQLSILRKSDNDGFHSYHYRYDERGRILEREYRRDFNKVGDVASFELDKSFSISIEKFEYLEMEGLDYKKIYYNNAGRVYQEEFFYYEENGYLIRQEARMKMGSSYTNTTYVYDELGRVKEKIIEKHIVSTYISKWIYEYDAHSNVLAQHYYKKDAYLTENQIVYSQDNLLIDAIITRDAATNLVTILKLSDYKFFD